MKKAALLISALTICLTFAFCSKDHQPVYRMTLDGSFTENATGKVTEVKLNYKHVILYDNDDLSGHYIFRNGDKDSHSNQTNSVSWLHDEDLWIGVVDNEKVRGQMNLSRFDDQFDEINTDRVNLEGKMTNEGDALSFSGTFTYRFERNPHPPLGDTTGNSYFLYTVQGSFTLNPR